MTITNCCLCGSTSLKEVMKIGKSGLANNLEDLQKNALSTKKYNLNLFKCANCNHIQLGEEVDPRILFSNYTYETGISNFFRIHFRNYAKDIDSLFNKKNKTVIDIGSNDCLLLDEFKSLGFKTIGIEPAKNLVDKYKDNHILFNDFLNENIVKVILNLHGKVDVVTANNVFAHNRKLISFAKSVKSLLKEDGLFIVEVQYLVDLVNNGYFDMIYHEHTSYHHIKPVRTMMSKLGLILIDVKKVKTHGGSIRLIFKKTKDLFDFVNDLIIEDKIFDLNIEKNLENLSELKNKFKKDFENKIKKVALEYDLIFGYAAPAKIVTLLSTLNKEIVKNIQFVLDDSLLKQKKYLPGSGIKIIGTEEASSKIEGKKSVCIIFAWNVADDIIKRLSKSKINPSLILVPLPQLREYNDI